MSDNLTGLTPETRLLRAKLAMEEVIEILGFIGVKATLHGHDLFPGDDIKFELLDAGERGDE